MKRISSHVKRKMNQWSKAVRVVGVQQPPDEAIPEAELLNDAPYITDAELSNWFSEFHNKLVKEQPFATTEEDAIFGSILLGELQRDIFEGAYKATKHNPVYAMEAFVAAHHVGIYPPLWVLDWLYGAFSEFLTSPDEQDLAKLLLVKRGRGKPLVKEEAQRVQVETAALNQILALTATGKSIMDAAVIVADQFESQGMECQSAETLAERFTKRGWGLLAKELKKAAKEASPAHSKPTKPAK